MGKNLFFYEWRLYWKIKQKFFSSVKCESLYYKIHLIHWMTLVFCKFNNILQLRKKLLKINFFKNAPNFTLRKSYFTQTNIFINLFY